MTATWNSFEKSTFVRRAKLKLRQCLGIEPRIPIETRLQTRNVTDWQFPQGSIRDGDVVYSFGVGDNIAFERILLKMGAEVHAFDPTPHSMKWMKQQTTPPNFHFHPWAVAGEDGHLMLYPRVNRKGEVSEEMYTLMREPASGEGVRAKALHPQSIADELDHAHVRLMKMDIEGAEYAAIDALLASELRPDILLVEFHHRFPGIGKDKTPSTIGGAVSGGVSGFCRFRHRA